MLNKKNCCSCIHSLPKGKELYCDMKACYLSVEHILIGCGLHTFPVKESLEDRCGCKGCKYFSAGSPLCRARNHVVIESREAIGCSLKSTVIGDDL